jgi:hypothetical protein
MTDVTHTLLVRLSLLLSVSVCVTLGVLASITAPADAAVTHAFIPGVSAAIGQGVPGGPPSSVSAMTVDEGHLWVAETEEATHTPRVNEFDAATGAFVRQLVSEEGIGQDPTGGVAVGGG